MLVEEHLDLLFVDCAHLVGRDGDLISVLVVTLFGECIDVGDLGASAVDDTETFEIRGVEGAARVVILALVALRMAPEIRYVRSPAFRGTYWSVVEPVCLHFGLNAS